MKKFILAVVAILTIVSTAEAKRLGDTLRGVLEQQLPKVEKSIEDNKELFERNSLTVKQMEEYFSRLNKKKDKDLLNPGLKFLKVSKEYQQWQAELIATLELEREIMSKMLETGEYDRRLGMVNLGPITERQRGLETRLMAAQLEYSVAVRAYNLKRGM